PVVSWLILPSLVGASAKGSDIARGDIASTAADESYNGHRRLLRPRRERPRGCHAADKRDELPPLHSITSSASARTPAGISRPSARAVLRLMTSSTFVSCRTGKSAGFVPLRMRAA